MSRGYLKVEISGDVVRIILALAAAAALIFGVGHVRERSEVDRPEVLRGVAGDEGGRVAGRLRAAAPDPEAGQL